MEEDVGKRKEEGGRRRMKEELDRDRRKQKEMKGWGILFPRLLVQVVVDTWGTYEKHVMMTTRGTRGDVQPFLALARGLAEKYGFLVTIMTELHYMDFVRSNSQVDYFFGGRGKWRGEGEGGGRGKGGKGKGGKGGKEGKGGKGEMN
jgi:hypothetical protein